MKRFSHFLSEARQAEDTIYGRRGAEKRRREQKARVMKKARDRLNQVTIHDAPPSAPAPQIDDSNLIMSVATTWDVLTSPSQWTRWWM